MAVLPGLKHALSGANELSTVYGSRLVLLRQQLVNEKEILDGLRNARGQLQRQRCQVGSPLVEEHYLHLFPAGYLVIVLVNLLEQL